jgi:ABC-type multidrug transport system ATPase subunit
MTAAVMGTKLEKRYPKVERPAITDFSFAIEPEEIVGLLGPNGAGKSTLMRMICGASHPTSGSLAVFGFDPIREPVAAKARVAAMHQGSPIDMMLPAMDCLRIAARFRGVPWREARPWIGELTEFLGLKDVLNQLVFQLSGGQKQRLQLARALLAIPQLLILDEPSAALDPAGRRLIWDLVEWLRDDYHVTVLWASHNIDELERNCDRVIVVNQGRNIKFARPRDLVDEFGVAHLLVTVQEDQSVDRVVSWAVSAGHKAESTGLDIVVHPGPDSSVHALIPSLTEYCRSAGAVLSRVSVERDSLEDVFFRLTQSEERANVQA